MPTAPPPPPSRHVTTNSLTGRSTFAALSPTLTENANLGRAIQRLVYTSPAAPLLIKAADLESYKWSLSKPTEYSRVRPDGGPNMWYLDVPPNSSSPMNRTVSLYFVVVVQGQIELDLDDGEQQIVNAGDVVVQRDTMHAWPNSSGTE